MNATIKTVAIALGLSFAAQAQQAPSVSEVEKDGYYAKMTILPNESKMRVLVANLENQNLWLQLKDAGKNVIFSRAIGKNVPQAHVILNMEELPVGIYTVELSNKTTSASKSFRKGEELVVTRPVETLVAVN
jgi:hypothetical protein